MVDRLIRTGYAIYDKPAGGAGPSTPTPDVSACDFIAGASFLSLDNAHSSPPYDFWTGTEIEAPADGYVDLSACLSAHVGANNANLIFILAYILNGGAVTNTGNSAAIKAAAAEQGGASMYARVPVEEGDTIQVVLRCIATQDGASINSTQGDGLSTLARFFYPPPAP